jgi:GntR family transcriptional regulator
MTYEGGSRAEVVEKTNWSEAPWDIRERLKLRQGEPVVVIKRVALIGDEPLFYIINYLPYDLGIKLYGDDRDLERFPIISLLREKYGVPLSRAVQTIEATLADTETAARLRVPVGAPVLLAERTYFARGGRTVQVSRAWYRADRYKYTVTLRHWRGSRRLGHRRHQL